MKKKIIIICMFLVCAICILINNKIVVTYYSVKDSKIPNTFNGYKIAQISDFHNCDLGSDIIKKLNKEQVDIIVITGDLVDANHTDIIKSINLISDLIKIAPVYYVSGNHEAWINDYTTLEKQLSQLGVTVLNNETIHIEHIDGIISITGIVDPDNYKNLEADSSGIIKYQLEQVNILDNEFNILLSHRPEAFLIYEMFKYDLVFTGHAHGGQFIIPFIGGLVAPDQGLFPKYYSGIYKKDTTAMIVNRGIGNSIIPIRINNRPEIVITTLENE